MLRFKCEHAPELPRGKTWLGSIPRAPDSAGLGWGLRICNSNKFPAGFRTTLENNGLSLSVLGQLSSLEVQGCSKPELSGGSIGKRKDVRFCTGLWAPLAHTFLPASSSFKMALVRVWIMNWKQKKFLCPSGTQIMDIKHFE